MPLVLTDRDLSERVRPEQCVEWMREAVQAAEAGRLRAPARAHAELGEGRLVFTAGALDGEWFGYRSYDTFDRRRSADHGDQVVVIQSAHTGEVRGIAVGTLLGQIRTGALGGLAVDLMARPDAASVGVIGTGPQAWRQIWAIAAVRDVCEVSIHSRTPDHAVVFAHRVRDELGLAAATCPRAEDAVRGRAVVVLATNSRSPVLDPSWLDPGTHVTTVGPKQRGAAEFGLDLLEAADMVVTDSLAQLHGYHPPSIVASSEHADRVRSLGTVAAGAAPGRRSDADLTVYLSVGLAGTEVHLLGRLLTP